MEGKNLLKFKNKFHNFRSYTKIYKNFYRFKLALARLKLLDIPDTRYIYLIFLGPITEQYLSNKICFTFFLSSDQICTKFWSLLGFESISKIEKKPKAIGPISAHARLRLAWFAMMHAGRPKDTRPANMVAQGRYAGRGVTWARFKAALWRHCIGDEEELANGDCRQHGGAGQSMTAMHSGADTKSIGSFTGMETTSGEESPLGRWRWLRLGTARCRWSCAQGKRRWGRGGAHRQRDDSEASQWWRSAHRGRWMWWWEPRWWGTDVVMMTSVGRMERWGAVAMVSTHDAVSCGRRSEKGSDTALLPDGRRRFGHGLSAKDFMPTRIAGGRHCPRWSLGARHLATWPLTGRPHSAAIFFFKYSQNWFFTREK
jgi:hypothetical protein